jgi:hypothetical protein
VARRSGELVSENIRLREPASGGMAVSCPTAQLLDQWVASDRLPTQKIDGAFSSLRIVPGLVLKPGDEIRIEGSPDGGETGALDYIEIQ